MAIDTDWTPGDDAARSAILARPGGAAEAGRSDLRKRIGSWLGPVRPHRRPPTMPPDATP